MGMLIPVFIAVLLNGFGYLIFREPKEVGPGPLMSSYIFMTACLFLLWDVRLYPRSLRKLMFLPQAFMEYLLAQFLIEHLVIDFWFPLEVGAIGCLPKIAESIEEMLTQGGWTCEGLCDVLKGEKAGYVISYFLSTFFLLFVLHATRAIDLRELKSGPIPFFKDIYVRLKAYGKRILRKTGLQKFLSPKKKLTFCENKKPKPPPCPEKRDPCGGGSSGGSGGGGILSRFGKSRYSSSGKNKDSKYYKKRCEDSNCYGQSYHNEGEFRNHDNSNMDVNSVSSISDDYDICDDTSDEMR